jgi:enoyl-CoA hydratase
MQPELLLTVADGIMSLTLNRPEAKNAITRTMALAIAEAIDELDGNPDIRVAVLSGAGDTFCSGMDLKAFLRGESAIVEGRGFGGLCERPPVKPLIAAVEGHALAGGLELVMSCDLIVAADTARFGIPEVKRGLVAGAGGLLRLPRQIPQRIAMEMALTGEQILAHRAYELGLINRIVPTGQSLQAAHDDGEIDRGERGSRGCLQQEGHHRVARMAVRPDVCAPGALGAGSLHERRRQGRRRGFCGEEAAAMEGSLSGRSQPASSTRPLLSTSTLRESINARSCTRAGPSRQSSNRNDSPG